MVTRFLKRRSVVFVEPINRFEQLEERVVLDATVDNVIVNATPVLDGGSVTVNEDSGPTAVNAHSVSEGDPGASYGLTVDEKPVSQYNAENGSGADVDVTALNFVATGEFTWQPNNTDVGVHTFVITANDGGAGPEPHTDAHSFGIVVQNTNDAPVLDNSGSPHLDAIAEDVTNSAGTLVSDIIDRLGGTKITDEDLTPDPLGIATIGTDNTHGTWEFKTATGTWTRFDD